MPIAAIAVSGAGWIGRALVAQGGLEAGIDPSHVFVQVASQILPVGLFGFVVAALLAALMSTADTLINAVGTIAIVDLWRPWRRALGRPLSERAELRAARIASGIAAVIGLALVPLFASFQSIYRAHGTFTAAVTPPLAVALLLGFVWPRFSGRAALLVMLGGAAAMAASFVWPPLVEPLAHGIALEPGAKSYSYIRALYGLVVCAGLGVVGTLIWPRRGPHPGTLVIGPITEKMRAFKGAEPRPGAAPRLRLTLSPREDEAVDVSDVRRLPTVELGPEAAARGGIRDGDIVAIWSTGWLRGAYQAVTGQVAIRSGIPTGQILVPHHELARVRLKPRGPAFVRRTL
jgi:SSS family solute:Na+ symporter